MRNGEYELVIAPSEYPGKKYRGRYIYEHHLIWWTKTGTVVPSGHVVHHMNGVKRDNSPDNLQLKTVSDHTREHIKPPEMLNLECAYCGVPFTRRANRVKWKQARGHIRFYCSISHGAKYQHGAKS
jgi:uncharacterized protein (DUF3820 family)